VAIQRTMVAIIENYQTEKGTVKIPEVLQKYMNNQEEIGHKT
jgi:seryl-tRNA synthetase